MAENSFSHFSAPDEYIRCILQDVYDSGGITESDLESRYDKLHRVFLLQSEPKLLKKTSFGKLKDQYQITPDGLKLLIDLSDRAFRKRLSKFQVETAVGAGFVITAGFLFQLRGFLSVIVSAITAMVGFLILSSVYRKLRE